jgi:hypothetical protein
MNFDILDSEFGNLLKSIFSFGYYVCASCFIFGLVGAFSGFFWFLKKIKEKDMVFKQRK